MNVGCKLGHYMKSRTQPRFGKLLEKLILESVHHWHHIFDVFGDPKVGHDIKMDYLLIYHSKWLTYQFTSHMSFNIIHMNVGCFVGHYMKSRS